MGGTLYSILLVVHVAGAVVAFGPMLLQQSWLKAAIKQPSEAAVSMIAMSQRALNTSLIGLIVALVAGISLIIVSDGAISFSEPWISASFTTIMVLAVVGALILRPALKELASDIPEHGADSDAAKAVLIRLNAGVSFFHIGLLVMLVLMFFQPGS